MEMKIEEEYSHLMYLRSTGSEDAYIKAQEDFIKGITTIKAQREFDIFKIGFEQGQQQLRANIEWGASCSVEECYEDFKKNKLDKEGKYVG